MLCNKGVHKWKIYLHPPTWNRYLMKMRLLLVVSSSVSRMHCSTPQLMASDDSRWANSLATLRSLLVSRRWMMAYCLPKQSSKVAYIAANLWNFDQDAHLYFQRMFWKTQHKFCITLYTDLNWTHQQIDFSSFLIKLQSILFIVCFIYTLNFA